MVYKKTTKTITTKRSYKKKGSRTRNMAMKRQLYRNPTHFFKRVCNWGNIAPHTVSTNINKTVDGIYFACPAGPGVSYGAGSLFFTIGDIPDYTEITSLFDRYQILGVAVKIMPYVTTSDAQMVGQTNPSSSVIIHSIIDYDDTNTPTASDAGCNAMREFESYKMKNINVGKGYFSRFLKPRIAVASYSSGIFNGYANMRAQWCDAASPSVQHFGFKYIMEAFNGSATQTMFTWFKTEYTLYFKTKDLR